jgi:hypothetical protein
MSPKDKNGRVNAELLRLKDEVRLLEALCGDDFSEVAVKAAAKKIHVHIDRIADLIESQ